MTSGSLLLLSPAAPGALNPSLSTAASGGAAVLSPRGCFGVRLAAFHTFPTLTGCEEPFEPFQAVWAALKPPQTSSTERKPHLGLPTAGFTPRCALTHHSLLCDPFSPQILVPGQQWGSQQGKEGWICCSIGLGLEHLGLNPCLGSVCAGHLHRDTHRFLPLKPFQQENEDYCSCFMGRKR